MSSGSSYESQKAEQEAARLAPRLPGRAGGRSPGPPPARLSRRPLTWPPACQAEQVAAGLLQQDVVVPFIRAVGVIVISEVAQAVHCNEAVVIVEVRVRETCFYLRI